MQEPPDSSPQALAQRVEALEVLLVEDCAVNALLTTTYLRQLGHKTTRAANGRDAIERFAQKDFDVVLLDLGLPEIDGFEVAAAIRESRGGRRVPIIAVTALADAESVRKLQSSGLDGYLEKPLRLPVLETMLLRVLQPADSEPPPGPNLHHGGLDREALLSEVDGDTELLGRMLKIFREQRVEQIEALRVALNRGDARALGAAAHALKGGIANFERAGAYTSAARLESLAASASLDSAPAEYTQLLGELRVLDRELEVLESSLVETALEDS